MDIVPVGRTSTPANLFIKKNYTNCVAWSNVTGVSNKFMYCQKNSLEKF